MKDLVSAFGNGKVPSIEGADLLGGKGHFLAVMTKAGVNVPPGVTITTKACQMDEVSIEWLVQACFEEQLNDLPKDALYSVRSGAPVSMPGMMDTILNVGIFRANLPMYIAKLGERAAIDCYRRFLQMYAETVLGMDHEFFEFTETAETTAADLSDLAANFEYLIEADGHKVPVDLFETLCRCAEAVFQSWGSERAIAYREANKISHDMGTAVTIQQMVFGNLNDNSATGVLFTRDPSTGVKGVMGEFLINAQGEDVVAGIRTPMPLTAMSTWNAAMLGEVMNVSRQLEKTNRDMQDIEFTIEDGKLYILQTRNAKRSGRAAFRVAHDMAVEGLITKAEAVARVKPSDYFAMSVPVLAEGFDPLLVGLPASPGVAKGVVVTSAAEAIVASKLGKVILVTKDTSPDDFAGMMAAQGILTATGGHTSHAAVVARAMNKVAVVGAGVEVLALKAGTTVTICGSTGRVFAGDIPVLGGTPDPEAETVLKWAFDAKGVRLAIALDVNADDNEALEAAFARIPKTGTVELRVLGLNATNGKSGLLKLRNLLNARKGLTGVLSLEGRKPSLGAGDEGFLSALGLDSGKLATGEESAREHVLTLANKSMWSDLFQTRWSVRLPESAEKHMTAVVAAGWKLTNGGKIPDVMKAWLKGVGMTPEKFLNAMADQGVTLDTQQGMEINEAVFQVLAS